MQDQYAADVGDFGRYGLLRALTGMFPVATPRLRLGVVWYPDARLRQPMDGKHRTYLDTARKKNASRYRSCDPNLYDALSAPFLTRSGQSRPSTRSGMLPSDTLYVSEVVPPGAARRIWADAAFKAVADCDLVFVDPDNGLAPKSVGLCPPATEFVYLGELQRGLRPDQSFDRCTTILAGMGQRPNRPSGTSRRSGRRSRTMRSRGRCRFRRGTGRLYLVVPPSSTRRAARPAGRPAGGGVGAAGTFLARLYDQNECGAGHINAATLW